MNFEILEQEDNKIISIKRLSDNKIFSIGDNITLKHVYEKGLDNGCIIQEILETTRTPKSHRYLYPDVFSPGSLVTNRGLIELHNAILIDTSYHQYMINRKECLSILDVINIVGEKWLKKLTKLVENKE